MFNKKIFLILVIISAKMTAQSDSLFYSKAEIKLNLISAMILIPNIGIEVKLSEKLSYQLDTSSVSYDQMEGSPFHATQIFNELRYYPRLKAKKKPKIIFYWSALGVWDVYFESPKVFYIYC